MPGRVAATHRIWRDRRGSVAIWVGISVPALVMGVGIAVNVGEGMVARQGVQLAADLAAQGGAISYARDSNHQQSAIAAVDMAEMNGIANTGERNWNAGTNTLASNNVTVVVGTGITAPTRTAVTVTASRTIPMAFASLLGGAASRTISATSTAEVWQDPNADTGAGPCVLALDPSAPLAIKVDNMGRIVAPQCSIMANTNSLGSNANAAIYLNSGTLHGKTIGTQGKVCLSNSGSNTVSPTIPNYSCVSPATAVQADPFAGLPIPSPTQAGCTENATYGACCIPPIAASVSGVSPTSTNVVDKSYTAWQSGPRMFSPANNGVFCGNTTIGGNGASDQFAPGVYYVINGNLTFNNSNVTLANGVSFVLIGRNGGNPGKISWTNYSNTYALSAPASGPTAGILFWQTCPASGNATTNTMAGGSTLNMSGAFYAKCGALSLTNNIQMSAAPDAAMRVVARTIYVAGSAGINASNGTAPAAPASVALVR